MVDLLKQLPPFEWRGVRYPVTSRSVTFQQNQVEHELGRRNQDLIEQTGAKNLRFSYTLAMREELFRGSYSALFTQGLRQLFIDFRNRTPGTLLDPVYGSYRVSPVSWSDDTDVTKRDGTDVRLEFVHSPEDDAAEEEDPPTIQAVSRERDELAVEAVELEESAADAGIPITSIPSLISEVFDFANGVGQQVLGAVNRADAELERVAFSARKLEDTAATIATPEAWLIQADSRSLRDRANRARDNRSQISPVLTRTVTQSQSVTSLAASLGVSTQALLEANPSLSSKPTVAVGTIVVIPSAKG